jgi:type I restriction enzyme S subunit
VRRGEIQERIDPKFIAYGGHQEIQTENKNSLGELVLQEPDYGAAERAVPMLLPDDTKYIRITDYGEDGIEPNHEFVIAEFADEKYLIEDEDILFARSGATAGKTFIYSKDLGKAIFAGYCIRFRFDKEKVLPKYVYFYTKTNRYAAWVNSMQRAAGQPNINKEEYKSFVIPLPGLDTQRALVAEMESARLARQAKLSQADELLKGIDGFVLEQLGIKLPKENTRKSFAAHLKQLQTSQTMNPDYFHPERMEALKVIQKSSPRLRVERLADIADFLRDIATVQKDDNYLGLASVQSNTGELVQVEETADGQCFRYQKNDVLFGRLRPYLNKVRCAEEDGVCSTEFHVIRLRKEDNSEEEISPEYLAVILRSSIILAQTKHMMTGNTHPRLTNEDVVNLVVPIPKDINLQKKIVSELQRRRAQARTLREEAEREWQSAKEKFEKVLLG